MCTCTIKTHIIGIVVLGGSVREEEGDIPVPVPHWLKGGTGVILVMGYHNSGQSPPQLFH